KWGQTPKRRNNPHKHWGFRKKRRNNAETRRNTPKHFNQLLASGSELLARSYFRCTHLPHPNSIIANKKRKFKENFWDSFVVIFKAGRLCELLESFLLMKKCGGPSTRLHS